MWKDDNQAAISHDLRLGVNLGERKKFHLPCYQKKKKKSTTPW